MKNIVHLDVYPMIEDGKISFQYPMYKLYSLQKKRDFNIFRFDLTVTLTKRDVEDSKEITPHIYCGKLTKLSDGVQTLDVYVNVETLNDPEFDNDDNAINKILRHYNPDFYKEGFEIVTDYNVFHARRANGTIEEMLDYVTNKNEKTGKGIIPYGQLTANFILLNLQKTHEKAHVIHFDPRSYYSNINIDRSKLNMYVPGNPEDTYIYHPMNMRGRLTYYNRPGTQVLDNPQYYNVYPLWLWDVDLFDTTKKPQYEDKFHMFVRLNRQVTEQSLKAYDDITHDLFLSGAVDAYHVFTSAENKETWKTNNEKVLKKISPNMNIDFKSIKNCGERGFSYVSLRSKKYPFMTPKFLELLGNGIVPLLNMETVSVLRTSELFPSEIYVSNVHDIEVNMNNLKDPKIFDHIIDEIWKKIEGQKQPLIDILTLTLKQS